ncbi:Gfo/Idh/MocA family protein [Cohnella hashimotonis]|uniref:Gfo/Idh/MocA family oxidoreductase n=1 Tax=Cohnella hashimotonis TaxID=2826895 RepID=A0ABT6TFQ7_9BACL|nr:Gfo/Idh/MocA family oxidoreductase [Cohnella hashimotonis]MDI4645130.1 Gfo/Idh/MocA family oxidoreductase [Cohnella hashimotonis]
MTTEIVKIGIIGCGVIGKLHIKSALEAPWVAVIAIADAYPAAARQAAEHFGIGRTYDDAAALLADRMIDAVVLAVPTNVRTELALQALEAGKHVLLEKPLAMSSADILRISDAAEKARQAFGPRTVAFCSSRFRHLAHAKAAAAWIAEDHLGDIRVIRCRVTDPSPGRPSTPQPYWRVHSEVNGGGIVSNWGIYDLDYLLGLTGWQLEPEWALARMWGLGEPIADYFPPDADTETYGAAYIQCRDRISLTYERGEFMAAPQERSWQIVGSKASLTLHMTWPSEKKIVASILHPETGVETRTIWEGNEDSSWVDKGALFDFTRAIIEGRPPMTGLVEALKLQRMMDAIYLSAKSDKPVQLLSVGDRATSKGGAAQ